MNTDKEIKGLVSVLMPVYNGLSVIRASINSLLRQTYLQWECIIVNDGSTDGTKEFLNSINDDRFVIHHFETNKGRPYARQKALDLASGEYIAMLDADDLYHPEKLNVQVGFMQQYPNVALVSSGMCSFGSNTDMIRIRNKGNGNICLYEGEEIFPTAHASSMLRRKYAIHISFNMSLKTGQDLDFLKRYLNGKQYLVLPAVHYYYSEFDSVNKKKIIAAYRLRIKYYFKKKSYMYCIINILKWIYGIVFYPFIKIETVIKRRGVAPTMEETIEFNKYCKPYTK